MRDMRMRSFQSKTKFLFVFIDDGEDTEQSMEFEMNLIETENNDDNN